MTSQSLGLARKGANASMPGTKPFPAKNPITAPAPKTPKPGKGPKINPFPPMKKPGKK